MIMFVFSCILSKTLIQLYCVFVIEAVVCRNLELKSICLTGLHTELNKLTFEQEVALL